MEFSVLAKMNPIQCDATGVGIPAAACNPHLVRVRSLKQVLLMYKNYSSVRSLAHIHPPTRAVHSSDFYFPYKTRNSAPHEILGILRRLSRLKVCSGLVWLYWCVKGDGLQFIEEGVNTSILVLTRCKLHPDLLYILIITLQKKEVPPQHTSHLPHK